MNRCERWNICPLGDTAKVIGCRKPHCPTQTIADPISPIKTESERSRSYLPVLSGMSKKVV